jgi:hypothetical protein
VEIDEKGFSFHPILLDGKRKGPMEAFCGSYGYDNAIKAYFDPEHKYHEDSHEWLGENFDPEAFDKAQINEEFMSWHVDYLPLDAYGFGFKWKSYRKLTAIQKP